MNVLGLISQLIGIETLRLTKVFVKKKKNELFMFNLHKELYYLFTHKNNFII